LNTASEQLGSGQRGVVLRHSGWEKTSLSWVAATETPTRDDKISPWGDV